MYDRDNAKTNRSLIKILKKKKLRPIYMANSILKLATKSIIIIAT